MSDKIKIGKLYKTTSDLWVFEKTWPVGTSYVVVVEKDRVQGTCKVMTSKGIYETMQWELKQACGL